MVRHRNEIVRPRGWNAVRPACQSPDPAHHDFGAAEEAVPPFACQWRVLRNDDVERVSAVVGPLGAVDDWPALESDERAILANGVVREHAPDAHRQLEVDDVAAGPGAFDPRE